MDYQSVSIDSQDETEKQIPRSTWLSILLYIVVLAAFGGFANLEMSFETRLDDVQGDFIGFDRIVIRDNYVGRSAFIGCGLLSLSLLVLSAMRVLWMRGIALVLVFIAFPWACFHHIFNNLGPWTVYQSYTVSSNETYAFLSSEFLQGQRLVIARLKEQSSFQSVYRGLVTTNGDSPRSWVFVVRPDDCREGYGQVYVTDRYIVGVRYENRCYMAYDRILNKPIGPDDVEAVSPFICLADDDLPHLPDVQTIVDNVPSDATYHRRLPTRQAVEQGLKHPNPGVREVAEQILAANEKAVETEGDGSDLPQN